MTLPDEIHKDCSTLLATCSPSNLDSALMRFPTNSQGCIYSVGVFLPPIRQPLLYYEARIHLHPIQEPFAPHPIICTPSNPFPITKGLFGPPLSGGGHKLIGKCRLRHCCLAMQAYRPISNHSPSSQAFTRSIGRRDFTLSPLRPSHAL